MECPRCKSQTVHIKNGQKVCDVADCTYTEFSPISYENDVRQYEGQKNSTNRYTQLYSNAMDNGGITLNKQGNFDKQYKSGIKAINDHCYLFKICGRVQAVAQARYASILRIKMKEKLQNQKQVQKDKNGEDKNQKHQEQNRNQKFFSNDQLAAYSLYSACFQNQLYFEDYNIYKKMLKIDRFAWAKLIKALNTQFQQKIDYVPIQKDWHYALRVCRKRRIGQPQQNAMKKMCENILNSGICAGVRRTTTAACVFWQVCRHSKRYRDIYDLNEICKKTKDNESINQKDQQKYFDCTPATVKDYFSKYIQKDLYTKFITKFDGFELPSDR